MELAITLFSKVWCLYNYVVKQWDKRERNERVNTWINHQVNNLPFNPLKALKNPWK